MTCVFKYVSGSFFIFLEFEFLDTCISKVKMIPGRLEMFLRKFSASRQLAL